MKNFERVVSRNMVTAQTSHREFFRNVYTFLFENFVQVVKNRTKLFFEQDRSKITGLKKKNWKNNKL